MKFFSLRTASAKQRGLAPVFPLNNPLRHDVRSGKEHPPNAESKVSTARRIIPLLLLYC